MGAKFLWPLLLFLVPIIEVITMIVRVFGDGANTDVPVTPETTCSDVIECCRDPGEESCDLVAVCPQHGGKTLLWREILKTPSTWSVYIIHYSNFSDRSTTRTLGKVERLLAYKSPRCRLRADGTVIKAAIYPQTIISRFLLEKVLYVKTNPSDLPRPIWCYLFLRNLEVDNHLVALYNILEKLVTVMNTYKLVFV